MRRFLQVFCMAFVLIASILPISVAAQTVNAFQLVTSASNMKTGDSVSVTVAGKSLSDDLYGAEIELAYNPSKLAYKSYSSSLTGKAFVMEPTAKDGKISLVYTFMGSSLGLNGDSDLFTLSFQAIGTGDTSVSLNSLNALNREGQPVEGTLGSNVNVAISTNTTPPPLPTTEPDPISTPGVVPVGVLPNAQGVVSIIVLPKELLAAAESSTNKSVVILVNKASDAKEVHVNLPIAEWLQAAQTSNIDAIKIQSDWATVTMDTKLLTSLEISDSSKLQFTISKVDPAALPSAITQITGSSVVYDFTLSLDGQKITQFTNNEVMVELPYTLAQGENPSQVVIYYVTGDGKLEVVKNGRYNAATGKLTFKPSHFSQYTAHHVPVSFQDMNGYGGWANEAVLGLAAREVIQGRSEGHYVPEGQVTRAEFVQMLTALFDLGDSKANTAFTDVETGAWYYTAIASAQNAGLVQGKDDGSFGVNDKISREDMAVLIYRVSKKLGYNSLDTNGTSGTPTKFLDSGKISVYAQEAITALQQAGLMNGITEGYFEPKGNSTRAQAASVLYRLYLVIQ